MLGFPGTKSQISDSHVHPRPGLCTRRNSNEDKLVALPTQRQEQPVPVAGHGGACASEDAAVGAEQPRHPSGGTLPSLSPQCLREMVATARASEPDARCQVRVKARRPELSGPAQHVCSRPQRPLTPPDSHLSKAAGQATTAARESLTVVIKNAGNAGKRPVPKETSEKYSKTKTIVREDLCTPNIHGGPIYNSQDTKAT